MTLLISPNQAEHARDATTYGGCARDAQGRWEWDVAKGCRDGALPRDSGDDGLYAAFRDKYNGSIPLGSCRIHTTALQAAYSHIEQLPHVAYLQYYNIQPC